MRQWSGRGIYTMFKILNIESDIMEAGKEGVCCESEICK